MPSLIAATQAMYMKNIKLFLFLKTAVNHKILMLIK